MDHKDKIIIKVYVIDNHSIVINFRIIKTIKHQKITSNKTINMEITFINALINLINKTMNHNTFIKTDTKVTCF